jgi:WD40 repeat protein
MLASGSGSFDRDTNNPDSVRLWDAASGKELRAISPEGHQTISSIAFSPDGKLLAGGGEDDITFWKASTGKKIRALSNPAVYSGRGCPIFS